MIKTFKILIIFIIFSLLLVNSSFAQEKDIQAPETLEEAKEMGEKIFETGKEKLPGIIERIWKEDVLPLWKKMYDWFDTHIGSKIKKLLEEEIEKRKPIIEEEFEKEKQEMKEELPKFGKSIWKRFKELWE